MSVVCININCQHLFWQSGSICRCDHLIFMIKCQSSYHLEFAREGNISSATFLTSHLMTTWYFATKEQDRAAYVTLSSAYCTVSIGFVK